MARNIVYLRANVEQGIFRKVGRFCLNGKSVSFAVRRKKKHTYLAGEEAPRLWKGISVEKHLCS